MPVWPRRDDVSSARPALLGQRLGGPGTGATVLFCIGLVVEAAGGTFDNGFTKGVLLGFVFTGPVMIAVVLPCVFDLGLFALRPCAFADVNQHAKKIATGTALFALQANMTGSPVHTENGAL